MAALRILGTILAGLALASACVAQHEVPSQLTASQIALASTTTADVITSFHAGGVELNPLLGRKFDRRDAAIKLGLVAAVIGLQRLVVRRTGKYRKLFFYMNISTSALLGWASVHNAGVARHGGDDGLARGGKTMPGMRRIGGTALQRTRVLSGVRGTGVD